MAKPNKFNGMLREYCVDFGFCGSIKNEKAIHVTDLIPKTGIISAEDFVEWLCDAEIMGEHDRVKYRDKLKTIFIKHMGGSEVDAKQLHSNYKGT